MEVLEHFKTISQIPHCSFEAQKLRDFLVDFAKNCGFSVRVDEFGNIHAHKGKPEICLQSHYDMVCIGEAPNLEIVLENGILSAKNSSLGADNGIGVAIMMSAMEKFENLEVLFTNDEEVGLLGATNFDGKILSKKVLNLDSEEESGVFIGCAGGVDIFARINLERENCEFMAYEVEISGLPGGHSGIEIHKDIPSAIKLLAKFVAQNNGILAQIKGGERNNSIPVKASCVAYFKDEPKSEIFTIKKAQNPPKPLKNSKQILSLINSFHQGVRSFNSELGIPNLSINLSIIREENGILELEFFARSMSQEMLENLKFEMSELCYGFGFNVSFKNQTKPWNPVVSDFAKSVLEILKSEVKEAKFEAIHAGLECGILLDKFSKDTQICSIGPNIHSPHSINERCELHSVDKISRVVDKLITLYSK